MNATPRQTFAIFCATKIDVRPLNLTKEKATELIGRSLNGDDITTEVRQLFAQRGLECKTKSTATPAAKRNWADLYTRACRAGMEAGKAIQPRPMVVQQHANPLDDGSPVSQSWNVPEGGCGFAWINIKPGNSSFARWLKDNGYAKKDSYNGGVTVWVHEFGQSYERKVAYADAFAKVLREAEVKAYTGSRLD